jgi:peptidoglycan/xylan/chitin deacetylase (PgdA/CDA1 family)
MSGSVVNRTLVNLCFHGVGEPQRPLEPGEREYWVSVPQFEELLDEVRGRPDVRLSFDDGNASDVEIALPRLRERGLSATFFLLAGRLDSPGSVRSDGVRALRREGMAIGSHGYAHRSWRHLDPRATREELVTAAERLAELTGGQHVDEAACPRGEYDRRSLRALRSCGYRRVFTSDRLPASPGAWLQPRYSLRERDDVPFLRTLLRTDRTRPGTAVRAKQLVKRWR